MSDHTHDSGPHVLPLKIYYRVYGILLLFTFITVMVSYLGLGPAAIPVAMAVAIFKAALVVGFFMHLRYDVRFNSFVFFGALIFLGLLFGFIMMDLVTRGDTAKDLDTFAFIEEMANVEAEAASALALESGVDEDDEEEEEEPSHDEGGGHH